MNLKKDDIIIIKAEGYIDNEVQRSFGQMLKSNGIDNFIIGINKNVKLKTISIEELENILKRIISYRKEYNKSLIKKQRKIPGLE